MTILSGRVSPAVTPEGARLSGRGLMELRKEPRGMLDELCGLLTPQSQTEQIASTLMCVNTSKVGVRNAG